MDGRSSKCSGRPLAKPPDQFPDNDVCVPRGLLMRELGSKQKLSSVSSEFQSIAEDRLVSKDHEELRCELPGPSRSTFLMVFSPDGTKVASTHGNHDVYITDLTTGKNVNTLSGHPRTPWCIAFHPSSNQILASGCLGGQVRVWDLHGGSEVWMADGQTVIASLAFHPTDRMLVIATYNELHFWDWSQPEPFTKCYTNNEKEKVRYVAFDPLGHKLITGISNVPIVQSQWDQWDRFPTAAAAAAAATSTQSASTYSQRPSSRADRERRISVCYRSLLDQYEQLVQRYFDLSRSRSVSTTDRGTDPMDFENDTSVSGSRLRDHSRPSTSSDSNGGASGPWRDLANNRPSRRMRTSSRRPSPRTPDSARNDGYIQDIFHNPWSRSHHRSGTATRTDSNAGESETEPVPGPSSSPSPTRSRNQLPEIPRHYLDTLNTMTGRIQSHSDLRRRSSLSEMGTPRGPLHRGSLFIGETGDVQTVPENNHTGAHGSSSTESHPDRDLGERPVSPVFSPSRSRRFVVSQSSAFQPRTPRGDRPPDSRTPRSSAFRRATQRISLNAATAAAVAAAVPDRRTPDSDPPRSRSPFTFSPTTLSAHSRAEITDFGVRYGIQLLSRHIDNMQRLCRARLEILQLQQIRRMWEDLQSQIRSLHSAVRESTITLPRFPETAPQELGLFSGAENFLEASTGRGNGENRSGGSSGHIPSVSQMLELARISDSSPAAELGLAAHDAIPESHAPEQEVLLFQSPAASSRTEDVISGVDSVDPASVTSTATDEASIDQQYSRRCHDLQQRLWRIGRKVYLRRPRLLSVNSRSARRQLGSRSSHNRASASQSRCNDSPRRPWFLHSAARSHRSASRSTNNVSSQVGPSSPPGRPGGNTDNAEASLNNSDPADGPPNVDESQPGPSGLCSWAASDSHPHPKRSLSGDDEDDDDDDDDDDEDDDEDDDDSESSSSGGGGDESTSIPNNAKKDDEQESSSSNVNLSGQKTEAAKKKGKSRLSAKKFNVGISERTLKKRLQEEIEKLERKSSDAPAAENQAGPSSSQSASSAPSAASTSGTFPPRELPNPQQSPESRRKAFSNMMSCLEKLVRQQREQERNNPTSQTSNPDSPYWNVRERMWETIDNSESDSDEIDVETPPASRTWRGISAHERLSNALQAEMFERERMHRAAAGARSSQGAGEVEEDWEWTRESTRLRARQVLSLMVESLTQFFEENGFASRPPSPLLDEQICNLHVLLQLALELTDLLLAQLACTRRELENAWVHRIRSPMTLVRDSMRAEREREVRERLRQEDPPRASLYRYMYRQRPSADGEGSNRPERSLRGRSEYSRRVNSRTVNCFPPRQNRLSPHSANSHGSGVRPGRNTYGRSASRPRHGLSNSAGRQGDRGNSSSDLNRGERASTSATDASTATAANIQSSRTHDAFTVPLVRVNDVPIPDTSLLHQPRTTRPQSPPLHPNAPFANPFSPAGSSDQRARAPWDFWPYIPGGNWRPRFLHPRYSGSNLFNEDSEDSPADNFGYFRANSVPETVIITDTPMTPNHRIQVWDFSKFQIPDISNSDKNIIVPECKIHNDASVDVSKDGRLLVTLLPSGRQSITTMLGVYSLQWETLGQCLYTTSFLQSAVSVSLSPASRYLLVGLASRRVALLPNDRHYMAQVFRLDGAKPGRSGRGRLCHMRDIEQPRDQGYMSLNCIRWVPGAGQGFVYGTNTGHLRVLR